MSDRTGQIEKLNLQKEKALKQAEIDKTNFSLHKIRGEQAQAEMALRSYKKNKNKADKKQKKIDILESKIQEEFVEEIHEEEFASTEDSKKYFLNDLKENYLEPIQMALEMLENGETSSELREIEIKDLQIAEAVIQSIFSENKKIFEIIRSLKVSDEETQDDEEDGYFDETYNEEEIQELDGEIENEIYGEIENELGYDFNRESDDEENPED